MLRYLRILLALSVCLGLFAHCGGGDSNSIPGEVEAGPDAVPDSTLAPDGSAAHDAMPDSIDDVSIDAAGDTGSDVGNEASQDAGDAGSDSGIDAGGDSATDTGSDGSSDAGDAADAFDAGPPCDTQHPCSVPLTCCTGACVDTTRDPRNCGACGNACSASQFCTGLACDDAVFTNVCANPNATVVFDAFDTDNEAGVVLGGALAASCTPPVVVVQAQQDDGGVIDPDSGRPITGVGNTFVAGGGTFGQKGVAYQDIAANPLVYGADTMNAWFVVRKTSAKIATILLSNLDSHHDNFFLELSVEPKSGTLCFFGAGMRGQGTLAAAYWANTEIVPKRANYPDAWYAYQWVDANNDGIPGPGDTYTLVAHGQ